MAQHTPGPWRTMDGMGEWIRDAEGFEICCPSTRDTVPLQDAIVERRANAHLIAAAPELLDALETMTAIAATFTPNGATMAEGNIVDRMTRMERTFQDAVNAARDVLAKARNA